MDSARNFETLGAEVARQIGTGCNEERRIVQIELLRAMTISAKRKQFPHWITAVAAAALLLGVVATVLFLYSRDKAATKAVHYWIGEEKHSAVDNEWIVASKDGPSRVSFENGSRFEFSANSKGRVLDNNRSNVMVEIGEGTIKAFIEKSDSRSTWTVKAGTYTVTAIGTVFEVYWFPSSSSLGVSVFQGSVAVNSPGNGRRFVLREGRRLTINQKGEEELTEINSKTQSEQVPASEEERERETIEASITNESEKSAITNDSKSQISSKIVRSSSRGDAVGETALSGDAKRENKATWQSYYDKRMYEEVMAEAEKIGLQAMYDSLGVDRLWQLANAARYAGRNPVASEALLSLRRRFAGSWRASIAAFLLGRIAIEEEMDSQVSCKWFLTYLQEDPGGKLVEEAMGRSIGVCGEAGLHAKARKLANDYLEKFPEGSFSTEARSALSK